MSTRTDRAGEQVRAIMVCFGDLLRSHQQLVNRLNVYPVPDGDTGTNMARTLDAVVAELHGAGDDLAAVTTAVAHGSLMGARGNSGVILSQMLRGMAASWAETGELTPKGTARALRAASTGAYEAVLRPVEGTILTVARAVADAAETAAGTGADLATVLRAARAEGAVALARTPEQLVTLKEAGVVDAGARGFLLLLDAALHVVAGEPLPEAPADDGVALLGGIAGHGGDGDLRYEVMFLLELPDTAIGLFKAAWGALGDSIVVVGGDGLWNCHVHTADIGGAIEAALDAGGRPRRIAVTDLDEQSDTHARREEHLARELAAAAEARDTAGGAERDRTPMATTAVVAVAAGDGVMALFASLGVRQVVTGGQTMNPSTAELLAAVELTAAPEVVLLPNNANIVPVAERVDALSAKSVLVVPTRSVPEALAALVVFDPEGTAATNARAMAAAVDRVRTGEVTRAVREATVDGVAVHRGDWLGLADGRAVAAGDGPAAAATAVLDRLVDASAELVTILTGEGATEVVTAAVTEWLARHRPGVDVEVHAGGQPLYPYLFGVE